jgi:ribosome maturation factor RimP
MIKDELRNKELYNLLAPVVEAAGFFLVELSEHDHHRTSTITAVIQAQERNTTLKDCASVHKLIFPRLELLLENRDVYLEVSTPGIQRKLKDVAEFKAFIDKDMRILLDQDSEWIEGRLFQVTENSIMIRLGQDEQIELPLSAVKKAKLVYNWEDEK